MAKEQKNKNSLKKKKIAGHIIDLTLYLASF